MSNNTCFINNATCAPGEDINKNNCCSGVCEMHPQHLQKLNARADVLDNHIHFVDDCSTKEFYSRDNFFFEKSLTLLY